VTNKLVLIINSFKVPKIKKILLYEMKFLVPKYSCLQNPWLGGYHPKIPVVSVLCPQLNLLNPPPEQNSWVRHCYRSSRFELRLRILGSVAPLINAYSWLSCLIKHRGMFHTVVWHVAPVSVTMIWLIMTTRDTYLWRQLGLAEGNIVGSVLYW